MALTGPELKSRLHGLKPVEGDMPGMPKTAVSGLDAFANMFTATVGVVDNSLSSNTPRHGASLIQHGLG